MKKIIASLLLLACLKSQGQVTADPTIGQVSFTNTDGNSISDTLPLGYVALLNVPIRNQSSGSILPAGSCKIKIGLGSKIILNSNFDLSLSNTSAYFSWTAEVNSGQVQLTGDLIADLPADFFDTAKFNIEGSVLDYSTITSNFLITNHNSPVILSDLNPANNSSFRGYKIIPPTTIPVNFTGVFAIKKDCSIEVSFTTENEVNVNRFQIEFSKDGINFTKAGSVAAANRGSYSYQFPINAVVSSPDLYLRIKSIDHNGAFKYSVTKRLNGECKGKTAFVIYPNPVSTGQDYATVKVLDGSLTGKFQVNLYDAAGKMVSVKEFVFNNQQQFNYPIGNIATGMYQMKITNAANGQSTILKLKKL